MNFIFARQQHAYRIRRNTVRRVAIILCTMIFLSPPTKALASSNRDERAKPIQTPAAAHRTSQTSWAESVRHVFAERAHRSALRSHKVFLWSQQGVASWYGPSFNGHRTSSGANLNGHKLTAAHKSLPFGTKLLVKDDDTGRAVIVTINDRGPFNDRILDVSQAAAEELGMVHTGVAHVKIAMLPSDLDITKGESLKIAETTPTTQKPIITTVRPIVSPRHAPIRTSKRSAASKKVRSHRPKKVKRIFHRK